MNEAEVVQIHQTVDLGDKICIIRKIFPNSVDSGIDKIVTGLYYLPKRHPRVTKYG